MIFDTFMVNDELDMLECRLVELEEVPNLVHVAVEANIDHQDHVKPFHVSENVERFAPWKDRLRIVRAKGLPPRTLAPDPWAREHAQREYTGLGMTDAEPDDIVLHGDIDEIPTAVVARNVRPPGIVAFQQRGHFWSLRWRYPIPWSGTVAAQVRNLRTFSALRDARNVAPQLPNAGWHLSWLPVGDLDSATSALAKVDRFCHPEVAERIVAGIEAGNTFLTKGIHVDGVRMERAEIDGTYPKWVREGRCPASWLQ